MANTPNDLELSYFAGFFDGEGCVAIYPKQYIVTLTNTDIRPLVRAKEIWGGYISCQKHEGREFAIQDLWRWTVYGHNSRQFLEDIRPFTKLKNDQIDCYLAALLHVPTKKGSRRKAGAAEVIDAATVRLKLLKRGG